MSKYELNLTDVLSLGDKFDHTAKFGTGLTSSDDFLQGSTVRLRATVNQEGTVDNPLFEVYRGKVKVFEQPPELVSGDVYEYYWDTRYNAPGEYVFVMTGKVGDMQFRNEKVLVLDETADSFRMPWDHALQLSDTLGFGEELDYVEVA